MLAGCATTAGGPTSADVDLPPAFEANGTADTAAALDRWWRLYEDPQLEALIDKALAGGFEARAAFARLEEARFIRRAALTRYDPQGNLQANAEVRQTKEIGGGGNAIVIPGLPGGSFAGLTNEGVTGSGNAGFAVSWELDLFGRRAANRGVADADFAAAQFNFAATRAALAAEVAQSLFQARALAVALDDAQASATIQRRLFDVLTRRARIGLTASSEAARVEADLRQAEAEATDLEAQIKAAQRALLVLLGEGDEPRSVIPISTALGTLPAAPRTIPGALLARRPDVRETRSRLDAAVANVRLARLELFPSITLSPGVGINAQRGNFSTTNGFWSLGAGLLMPILDRPRLLAQAGAEGARAEQAAIAYERAVQTAFSEADQALIRLEADRRRIALLDAGLSSARTAYDAALRRFELGFSDLQAVLDAERVFRQSRTGLTNARSQALQRSVQLFQALGGGWPSPPPAGPTQG
jgi:NodT family efflux transporter outer membrane factor (OMF) lipoprotein